jgi:tetratricopeptide (TPR) repeat protein
MSLDSITRQVRDWEKGQHFPRAWTHSYAAALGIPVEELFPPKPDPAGLNPDDRERLALALDNPARIDSTVVESLATILAMQRRLDDTLGPGPILPTTLVQTGTVTALLREARGPVRDAIAPVAAEYVQFAGWLHAQLRHDAEAVRLLTEAEELADDIGDGTLAAQATNFKGWLARQQRRPRAVIRHFLTAYNAPGAHPAQRLGDAVQAAHGYATLGEQKTALHLLDEAEALSDKAARELPPGTAYWLSPDFHRLNIGLALLPLNRHSDAAQHLAAGLDGLPDDQRDAQWTAEYRAALDEAREQAS